ncbi:MAG: hypothetical protein CFE26_07335 [Verrucomicrobiales bacterium VVV1]|nr:MAG: hypothetical protein CFE26_07335 [Verrucomicrobiales bacterium VVV1]
MGKLIQLMTLCALWPVSLTAQSAANFKPELLAPTDAPEAKEEKAEADAGPVPQIPSRYAGAEVESYVASLNAILAIRSRANDPFGQSQDPAAKPLKPKIVQQNMPRPIALPSIKFSEVIAKIPVSTVIPGEGRFLVGTRSFLKGDRFPVRYQTHTYNTQILDVTARTILFRNLENGETGSLTLDLMPQGMSKGNQGLLAPGMQPARGDAPLELESDPINSVPTRTN